MTALPPYRPTPASTTPYRDMDPYRSGSSASGVSSSGGGSSSSANGAAFPHVKDLVAKAQRRLEGVGVMTLMGHLLQIAEQSATQIDFFLSMRKPDYAFVEYLVLSEIVTNIIPRHKDYPILAGDRGPMHRKYKEVQKVVNERASQITNIKSIITNDNSRSGVQPAGPARPYSVASERPFTPPYPGNGSTPSSHSRHLSMPGTNASPEPHVYPRADSMTSASSLVDRPLDGSPYDSGRTTPSSYRPEVKPKPASFQQTIPINGKNATNAVDPLTERFARLKATGAMSNAGYQRSRPQSRESEASFGSDLVRMPSPGDYNGNVPSSSLFKVMSAPPNPPPTQPLPNRPMGPRDAPSRPAKIPLDTSFALMNLPKEPSPTYSPARNMSTPGNINPPRQTPRSIVGTGGRSNSLAASSVSSRAPSISGESEGYFPPVNGAPRGPGIRRRSLYLSSEYQISSDKLFDYIKLYNVLIIDVRTREQFDEGHIMVNSQCAIMCIDPTSLRDNMSATELEDSLVLSPQIEEEWFKRREEFDLVIYHDQSTPDASFLKRPVRSADEISLKRVFESLYEFNEDKPLQRAPILLEGGLDSWIDLLGVNSLMTSNTAPIRGSTSARPLARRSLVTNGSELYIQKKRRRVYAPLDADETQKWAERARSESVALGDHRIPEDGQYEEEEDVRIPIYQDTNDFFRRFPDVSKINMQSMVAPPRRPSTQAPAYQPPSVPQVPSRPAPAAPRVTYSGVHDRDSSPYNAGMNRSSHQAAYIPSSQMFQHTRLPRTGLINFGVTCYMNATIQALNATIPLTAVFRDNTYVRYLQKDNWKGSRGLIPQHYANLVQNLWKGDVGACRPTTFRNFCARLNREWGVDRQQDAKEFFDFLIDFLHEDLNVNWNNPPPHVLTAQEEATRERMPKPYAAKIEWQRYSKRERSIISDLFAGQHASRLRCTTCGFTSTTYEAFWSISVEIPRQGTSDIYNCLKSYCLEERLSGDEVWRCPNCKKEREATKKITITRAPRYLVVHFKRFSAGHYEMARKVRTPIEFPLTGLNLEPFMVSPPTPEDDNKLVREQGPAAVKEYAPDESMIPPYTYNAYAVIRHLGGTLSSGHYVSLVKDPGRGCWRQFNDEKVIDFDPRDLRPQDRLQNEQAYIVFYERMT